MAVSGSFDFSQNRDELIKDAYTEAGVYDPIQTIEGEDNEYASRSLNRMLKAWQADGLNLWTVRECTLFMEKSKVIYSLGPTGDNWTEETHTETAIATAAADTATSIVCDSTTGMTAADIVGIEMDDDTMHWTTVASVTNSTTFVVDDAIDDDAAVDNVIYHYTNKAQRPLKPQVDTMFFHVHNGADRTVFVIGMDEYATLSSKTQNGTVNQVYFDPLLTNSQLRVYNPTTTSLDIIKGWYKFPVDDMDSGTDDFSYPQYWQEAILYNLAYRLAKSFKKPTDMLRELRLIAKEARKEAKDYDVEMASLFMQPADR